MAISLLQYYTTTSSTANWSTTSSLRVENRIGYQANTCSYGALYNLGSFNKDTLIQITLQGTCYNNNAMYVYYAIGQYSNNSAAQAAWPTSGGFASETRILLRGKLKTFTLNVHNANNNGNYYLFIRGNFGGNPNWFTIDANSSAAINVTEYFIAHKIMLMPGPAEYYSDYPPRVWKDAPFALGQFSAGPQNDRFPAQRAIGMTQDGNNTSQGSHIVVGSLINLGYYTAGSKIRIRLKVICKDAPSSSASPENHNNCIINYHFVQASRDTDAIEDWNDNTSVPSTEGTTTDLTTNTTNYNQGHFSMTEDKNINDEFIINIPSATNYYTVQTTGNQYLYLFGSNNSSTDYILLQVSTAADAITVELGTIDINVPSSLPKWVDSVEYYKGTTKLTPVNNKLTVNSGTTITVKVTVKTGYDQKKANAKVNNETLTYNPTTSLTGSKDLVFNTGGSITISGEVTLNKYTITYSKPSYSGLSTTGGVKYEGDIQTGDFDAEYGKVITLSNLGTGTISSTITATLARKANGLNLSGGDDGSSQKKTTTPYIHQGWKVGNNSYNTTSTSFTITGAVTIQPTFKPGTPTTTYTNELPTGELTASTITTTYKATFHSESTSSTITAQKKEIKTPKSGWYLETSGGSAITTSSVIDFSSNNAAVNVYAQYTSSVVNPTAQSIPQFTPSNENLILLGWANSSTSKEKLAIPAATGTYTPNDTNEHYYALWKYNSDSLPKFIYDDGNNIFAKNRNGTLENPNEQMVITRTGFIELLELIKRAPFQNSIDDKRLLGAEIPEYANMDDYDEPGLYYSMESKRTKTLYNIPSAFSGGFHLFVLGSYTENYPSLTNPNSYVTQIALGNLGNLKANTVVFIMRTKHMNQIPNTDEYENIWSPWYKIPLEVIT